MQIPGALRTTRGKRLVAAATAAVIVIIAVVAFAISDDSSDLSQAGNDNSEQPGAGGVITPGTRNDAAPGQPGGAPEEQAGAPGQSGPGGASGDNSVAQGEARAAGVTDPQPLSTRAAVRCDPDGEPKTGSTPGEDSRNGKKWVTVGKLNGGCDKSSDQFSLRGIDTRLVWQSDASNFNAFIIDPSDPDAAAGYSDASCNGPCAEYQFLANKAGKYNLRVQADGGPWRVLVQEYR